MAQEALDHGALLTAEDLAFRIFNCGLRTMSRDRQALAEQGVVVPLRAQQKDVGRALSHRAPAVELYLKGHTFPQIRQRIHHSLPASATYVVTFALVVAHTRHGHSLDAITLLLQVSPTLVRQYQDLYQGCCADDAERIDAIIARVKARGFAPSQLEERAALEAQTRGSAR